MSMHLQQVREHPERPVVVRDHDVSALVAVLAGVENAVRLQDSQGLVEFLHRRFTALDLVSDEGVDRDQLADALLALNHRLREARGEHESIP
ncbi:hypothetical protein ABUW04_32520 [Streptacidiphilus sp. N1-10]|uniref:Uncharacterized protein n=1 Tax=Streptacidiphilus jeojiensis TaxID=3229225 RepID=A0ABV6XXH0_9ACTN